MKIECDECGKIVDENKAIRRSKKGLILSSNLYYCSKECIDKKDKRSRLYFWLLIGSPIAIFVIVFILQIISFGK